MRLFQALTVTLLVLLGGCDKQAAFDKFVPKDEAELSKSFVALFMSKDFASIERQLDPSLLGPESRITLQKVAEQFPPGVPSEIQILGANTVTSPKNTTYDFTLQYIYPQKWLLVTVVLQKQDGKPLFTGIHVNLLTAPLQELNRFALMDKTAVHYLFLVLAVAIPVFVLVALVLCIRAPIPRRKWLWILFVLLGFGQFSLNWSDGTVNILPLSFMFLGAGYFQSGPAAPYILTVALPIGALLFFVRKRRWYSQSAA